MYRAKNIFRAWVVICTANVYLTLGACARVTVLALSFIHSVHRAAETIAHFWNSVKVLGEWKERKKTKMTKLDFHRFQVRHFSNNFEPSPCYCKMGQRQRADLSVYGRIKFITRWNISVWMLIHCMYPPSCLSVQPYIGSHYRASLIQLCGVWWRAIGRACGPAWQSYDGIT